MRRALVLALALLLPACDHLMLDAEGLGEPDMSGSVRIPLATTTDDGTTYLLRDATLEISGAAMMTLSSPTVAETSAAQGRGHAFAEALSTPLPAGNYTLFLRPGFHLIEIDPAGVQRNIEADVTGGNPLRFSLREIQDTTLKLAFSHEGRSVVFGGSQAVRVTRAF